MPFKALSAKIVRSWFTAERLSAGLVYASGGLVGAYAAPDFALTSSQWAGAALAVSGSVLVAVMVRVWPKAVVTAD